jgi:hypothetical protein
MQEDRKEPTGYELQRSIDRVEKRMSEGISDIKILIAGLVSRDLFDYESKVQNAKIEGLEKRLSEHENSVKASRWRFWVQVVIPLLAIVAGVVIALL